MQIKCISDADQECQIKGADIVFVMDVSGSIGESHFKRMKNLAIDVINSFEIGLDRTRVGWISFNENAWVSFHLNVYSNKASLMSAIHGIPYEKGYTAIGRGLETLRTQGFNGGRNSFDIPEVAIVVTDGQTNTGIPTSTAAERLRRDMDRNVNVFAVGVGPGVNNAELAAVASAGIEDVQSHMHHIDNFNQLSTIQRLIRARTCFGKSCKTNPWCGIIALWFTAYRCYVFQSSNLYSKTE